MNHHHIGHEPGASTPIENEKALGAVNSKGLLNTTNTAAIVSQNDGGDAEDFDQEHKRFATLRAQAGLLGHTLYMTASGYVMSRWGQTRHLVDLDDVEAQIKRMGGKP